MTLDPGHEGDARPGLGFKAAAGLSGSGTEGGEAVLFPGHPGRRGIYRSVQMELHGSLNERAWVWHPHSTLLPHSWVGPHPQPPPDQTQPGQNQGYLLFRRTMLEPNM